MAARGLLLKTVHQGSPWETFAGKFTEVKEQLVSKKHSGRGRYSTKFLQGGVRPEVQTVNQPQIYHFFYQNESFRILSIEHATHFTYLQYTLTDPKKACRILLSQNGPPEISVP